MNDLIVQLNNFDQLQRIILLQLYEKKLFSILAGCSFLYVHAFQVGTYCILLEVAYNWFEFNRGVLVNIKNHFCKSKLILLIILVNRYQA